MSVIRELTRKSASRNSAGYAGARTIGSQIRPEFYEKLKKQSLKKKKMQEIEAEKEDAIRELEAEKEKEATQAKEAAEKEGLIGWVEGIIDDVSEWFLNLFAT